MPNQALTANSAIEVATTIYKTTDYGIFNNIKSNRKLNPLNYSKLMQSMKEEQLMIPICVNEEFMIIDGQHRLKACKELKLPVFFYMAEGYGPEQMKRANLVSANWTIDDFLNAYIEDDVEVYLSFNQLKIQSGLHSNDLIRIIAKIQAKPQGAAAAEFKNGTFELTEEDVEEVSGFLNILEDFNFFSEYKKTKFIASLLDLYFYEGYDHDHMLSRLEKDNGGRKEVLSPSMSKDDFLETLSNCIYSFGSSRKNIYYDKNRKTLYMGA